MIYDEQIIIFDKYVIRSLILKFGCITKHLLREIARLFK